MVFEKLISAVTSLVKFVRERIDFDLPSPVFTDVSFILYATFHTIVQRSLDRAIVRDEGHKRLTLHKTLKYRKSDKTLANIVKLYSNLASRDAFLHSFL